MFILDLFLSTLSMSKKTALFIKPPKLNFDLKSCLARDSLDLAKNGKSIVQAHELIQ